MAKGSQVTGSTTFHLADAFAQNQQWRNPDTEPVAHMGAPAEFVIPDYPAEYGERQAVLLTFPQKPSCCVVFDYALKCV